MISPVDDIAMTRRPRRVRTAVANLGASVKKGVSPGLCASEGGATAADVGTPLRTSLGAMLSGHILRDGEVVLLILKPSLWFIVFSSLRFLAAGLIAVIAAKLWVHNSHAFGSIAYAATFVVAGRAMWAVLQWMADFA